MNDVIQKREKLQKIIDLIDSVVSEVDKNKDIIIKPDAVQDALHLVKNTLIVNKSYLDPQFLLN